MKKNWFEVLDIIMSFSIKTFSKSSPLISFYKDYKWENEVWKHKIWNENNLIQSNLKEVQNKEEKIKMEVILKTRKQLLIIEKILSSNF